MRADPKAADPHPLDTNVLLRYLTRDHEEMALQTLNLLQRIEAGQETVVASAKVSFETVYTLQTFYNVSRSRIRELLSPILSMPGFNVAD